MNDHGSAADQQNSQSTPGSRLEATGLLAGLGAAIPIVAAPMAGGPSTPALVLAAAEAGGIGFLAGGYKKPDQLSDQISAVRAGISRFGVNLFGVNLFAPNPVAIDKDAFAEYAEALREFAATFDIDLREVEALEDDDDWADKVDLLTADPVPVVSFTFGLPPAGVVRRLRKAGSLVIQTVTNPDEAEQAVALGVDGLVVQSYKAGGHSGTLTPAVPVAQIPLDELLDRAQARVRVPLWAAGGVSTPGAVREALNHGAEAVAVGSVLLRSPESGASETYKSALADENRSETVLTTAFSGRPARALRNSFTDRFHSIAPAGYPAIHHLTSPLRKVAAAAGAAEAINIWAGTGYPDATDQPAGQILRHLAGAE
ncbi:nitronate monooxygenase [Pseudarthrobacter sp. CC12]|uniref:NAD(P)H-dependent flavin oxidoreductase n=1 Tax=Pseudarthrobacter sp. CC12 TaxID=3029193 RepID=UPI0032670CFC